MARPTQEYLEWLEENNFSPQDEKLILKTATGMTFLWFLLSCIPTLGMFFLPLLINAWTQRKIVKQKSFEPRPGLLYSLFAVAMYISYILIIPWIFAKIAKKAYWGSGLRRLIRKGKVGNGPSVHCAQTSDTSESTVTQSTPQEKKSSFTVVTVIVVVLILLAVAALLFLPKGSSEVSKPSISIGDRSWTEIEPELIRSGIGYTVTYREDLSKPVNTILHYTQNVDGTEYAFTVVSPDTTVPDFSAVGSEDALVTLAAKKDLVLQVKYLDSEGNLHDANPGGKFDGIETVAPASGSTVPRGSGITVTVRIQPEAKPTVVGQWHICQRDYSLELSQLTFQEDGSFSYYGMGYLPVYTPTDLYLYGQYWSGARGSTDFSGTYTVEGDQLLLSYSWYNFDTDQNVPAKDAYTWQQEGDTLSLTWLSGDNQSYLQQTYTAGLFPAGTNPEAITSATGTWYYFEKPEAMYGNGYVVSFTQLTVNSDGTCSASNYILENSQYRWVHLTDEWPYYEGTCSYDGKTFDIHYTRQLQVVWDQAGNPQETFVPCDIHIRFPVQMDRITGTVTDSDSKIVQIGRLSEFPEPGIWADFNAGSILDHYLSH